MVHKQKILHQVAELESSVEVLSEASRGLLGPVEDVEFFRQEVPLAIEDAQRALAHLRRLAQSLSEAA